MSGFTPQLVAVAASAGVGFLMLLSGVQKNALEWRRPKRRCPSCGRRIDGRSCSGHH